MFIFVLWQPTRFAIWHIGFRRPMRIRAVALRAVSLSPHAHALQKRNRASVPTVGHGGQSMLVKVVEHIPEPAQNSIGCLPVPLMFACDREAQGDLPRFVGQSQHAEVANHLPSGFNLYSALEPLARHIRVHRVNAV